MGFPIREAGSSTISQEQDLPGKALKENGNICKRFFASTVKVITKFSVETKTKELATYIFASIVLGAVMLYGLSFRDRAISSLAKFFSAVGLTAPCTGNIAFAVAIGILGVPFFTAMYKATTAFYRAMRS